MLLPQNELEMSLQDRVAFACTYLDDRQLCAHISSLTQQVMARGDISGLFLTGLPNEGISLLANYVNMVSSYRDLPSHTHTRTRTGR